MPRLLIVSPHFPPVNAPDMQRVRQSLPHFVAAGWEVTVLTVADPTPGAPLEPELLETIPTAVQVERVPCFSRGWTRWLGIGNVALRALPFLFFRGSRLLSQQRHDAVYFSTTQFIVLPFGRLWKMLHGVPCIIDLQDPWVTDYYERPGAPRPPGGWKYRISRNLARVLEGWTMRGAAHLITVSASYVTALRERHAGLAAIPFTELPFGSAASDLQLAAQKMSRLPPLLPPGPCRIVFAGAIGPGTLPLVDAFFAGLAEARRGGLDATVHFFGTSYAVSAESQPVTLGLAAQHGLTACVHEQSGRLRYFDALRVMLEADLNLLFGSTDLAFTPSKILTLLAAGRPILALAPAGSAMIARLHDCHEPCLVLPPDDRDRTGVRAIAERLRSLHSSASDAQPAPRPGPDSARTLAERQLEIFAQVITPR